MKRNPLVYSSTLDRFHGEARASHLSIFPFRLFATRTCRTYKNMLSLQDEEQFFQMYRDRPFLSLITRAKPVNTSRVQPVSHYSSSSCTYKGRALSYLNLSLNEGREPFTTEKKREVLAAAQRLVRIYLHCTCVSLLTVEIPKKNRVV